MHRSGDALAALLDPAFKDASFLRLYASAVLAIATGQGEDDQVAAIEQVLRGVQRFVPIEDVELAEDALAQQVMYEAYLRAGRTHEKAITAVRDAAGLLAQVPRTQPRRYPVAPDNPAFVDQLGATHSPMVLTAVQRDEVRRFEDDVVAERPRLGRPRGSRSELLEREEFWASLRRSRAYLKRSDTKLTKANLATDMGLTPRQLRDHLNAYGEPPK